MNDNIGKYFICNSKLYDVDEYNRNPSGIVPGKVGELAKGDLYEVLRAIDGKLLFYHDHIDRLTNTIAMSKISYVVNEDELKAELLKLIEACGYTTCNLKIVLTKSSDEYVLYAYLSKFSYPEDKTYVDGVSVDYLSIERNNPNAKVIYVDYKKKVSDAINDNNLFEVLLVNNKGMVTEGSRTNVFFIFGSTVYTAPAEVVLEGITRKYVFKACNDTNIKICEEELSVEKVLKADGVFLSGTSIKVLPVHNIGDVVYNTGNNDIFNKILSSYNNIICNGLE